jgi:2-hydroxychromene-2-carboxylate isomerase
VLDSAAERAALDATSVLADAHNKELREEAGQGWSRGVERDKIFGVPSFIFAGKLYWGQDRMHHVRSAVLRKRG